VKGGRKKVKGKRWKAEGNEAEGKRKRVRWIKKKVLCKKG
jgi:hypothetical protein